MSSSDNNKVITKETIHLLRVKIEAALGPLGEEFGLSFTLGTARYNSHKFNIKLTAELTETADGRSVEEVEFGESAKFYGLEPSDYGRTFRIHNGGEFRLVGFKPRSPRYPIICEKTATGKRFKFTKDIVKAVC